MTKTKDRAAELDDLLAQRSLDAGFATEEYNALIRMQSFERYRLDDASIAKHGITKDIAYALEVKGLAEDISNHYSGDTRAIQLSEAGALLALILRGAQGPNRQA